MTNIIAGNIPTFSTPAFAPVDSGNLLYVSGWESSPFDTEIVVRPGENIYIVAEKNASPYVTVKESNVLPIAAI
jgi:hypothetical protein